MKKIFTCVIMFIVVFSSVSCTTQKNNTDTNTPALSSSADMQSKGEDSTASIVKPPDNPSLEPSVAEMIKNAQDYPPNYPKFSVTSNDIDISWIRTDANYTGIPGGKVENTNFGADDYVADQALKATDLKPGAIIELHAAEVSGLDHPKYKVFIYDNTNKDDPLVSYPVTKNQMNIPNKAGKYLFLCNVDWGKGDNEIGYWFKINVVAD